VLGSGVAMTGRGGSGDRWLPEGAGNHLRVSAGLKDLQDVEVCLCQPVQAGHGLSLLATVYRALCHFNDWPKVVCKHT